MKNLAILLFLVIGYGASAQLVQKNAAAAYTDLWIKQNTERAITGTIMNTVLNKVLLGMIDTLYKKNDSTLAYKLNGTEYTLGPIRGTIGSASSPLTLSGGVLGIQQAGAAQSGYLSSAEWNTFNNKLGSVDTGNISNFFQKVRGLFTAGSNVTITDGTISATGGGGGGSQTIQQVLTTGSTFTGNNTLSNGGYTLRLNGNNGSYSAVTNGATVYQPDSTLTQIAIKEEKPFTTHPDHVSWFENMSRSDQLPYNGKNNVRTMGWNIAPGGGAVRAGRPGIGLSFESNYHSSGDSSNGWQEAHMFYINRAGIQKRLYSYTVDGNGIGSYYISSDAISARTLKNVTPFDYFGASGDSASGVSLMSINSNTGKSAIFSINGSGASIYPSGFSAGTSALDLTNFERVTIAKNSGVPLMDIYQPSLTVTMRGDLYDANANKHIYNWNFISGTNGNFKQGYFSKNPGAGLTGWTAKANIDITNDKDSVLKVALVQHDHNFNAITKLYYGGNLVLGLNESSTVDTKAILQLNSTTRVFLPPRMTSTQRDAISSPTAGSTIYCSNCTATDASTGVTQTYNGSTWKNHW